MKISIALATFNGEKYLQTQLDSFAAQARLPDELVICDDGSSDRTLDIAQAFARSAGFNVRIFKNEKRLGFANNFGRAMELCSGDCIFLSDQDDLWFPNKIKRVEQFFVENPTVWLVLNDAEITDGELHGTGVTSAKRVQWSGYSTDGLVNGCFMAFRAQFRTVILPIPAIFDAHDKWINTLGQTLRLRTFLPDVLQYYRRHASNSSLWAVTDSRIATRWNLVKGKLSRKNRRIDPVIASEHRLLQLLILKERLMTCADYLQPLLISDGVISEAILKLEVERKANEARKIIQQKKILPRIFSALSFYWSGGYRQFEGWKSLSRDVLR